MLAIRWCCLPRGLPRGLKAYILQAEHGDFDKAKHTPDALKDIRQYMPPQQALSNPKQNKKLLLAE